MMIRIVWALSMGQHQPKWARTFGFPLWNVMIKTFVTEVTEVRFGNFFFYFLIFLDQDLIPTESDPQ